jgi:GT2 family glycosyltransferase
VVHHIGSSTFGERSDFAFYHSHRNLVWTYVKNMPSGMFWLYFLEHLVANIIYVLYYALRGRGKVLIRAKYDAIKGLSAAKKKRDTIQKRNKAASSDLLKHMERGWLQPYLLGYQLRKSLKKND